MRDIERVLASYKGVVPGMSYKATRKILFSMVGREAARDKATRKLIDSISLGAVKAFDMGKADGRVGRAKQTETSPMPKNASDLQLAILNFANSAYSSGYEVGEMIRNGGE